MKMIYGTLSCILIGMVAGGAINDGKQFHKMLTTEEFQQVFNNPTGGAVPKYDIVAIEPPRIKKRSDRSATYQISLDALGSNVDLWLKPIDDILVSSETPIYEARSNPEDSDRPYIVRHHHDLMDTVGQVMEEDEKRASIIVKRSVSGETIMSGHVGSEGWTIRPVPSRLTSHVASRYRRSIDNTSAGFHVISKQIVEQGVVNNQTIPYPENLLSEVIGRSKRSVPEIIYPQILVVVDYDTYKMHGDNTVALVQYLLVFWNSVSMKYKSLRNPQVKLNIAGILIAKDPEALPFILKNTIKKNKYLYAEGVLQRMGKFLKTMEQDLPLESYDIAVVMTPATLCRLHKVDGGIACLAEGVIGLAPLGQVCNDGDDSRSSVTVINDHGAFDGAFTAAHELGHIFGVNHDDGMNVGCDVGYIMSSTSGQTKHPSEWSPCSLNSLSRFFRNEKLELNCLYNKPKMGKKLLTLLPGQLLTMDQRCKALKYLSACPSSHEFSGSSICKELRCRSENEECKPTGYDNTDGTLCGDKMMCINRVCVSVKGDDETIEIPKTNDYVYE